MNTRLRIVAFVAIVVALLLPSFSYAQENLPNKVDGYLVDTMGWFTDSQKQAITRTLANLNELKSIKIVILTINDCGSDPKAFTTNLATQWGLEPNGILINSCWYDGVKNVRRVQQHVGANLRSQITQTIRDNTAKKYFASMFEQNTVETILAEHKGADALIGIVNDYDAILQANPQSTAPRLNHLESQISNFLLGFTFGIRNIFCCLGIFIIGSLAYLSVPKSKGSRSRYRSSTTFTSSRIDTPTDTDNSSSDTDTGDSGVTY